VFPQAHRIFAGTLRKIKTHTGTGLQDKPTYRVKPKIKPYTETLPQIKPHAGTVSQINLRTGTPPQIKSHIRTVKGKMIPLQARCGPEGGYSSMTMALEGCEWSAARPGHTLPPGRTGYPFYRRLGGPQGRSGRAENLVPTGIRSRTVQPVAQSLYRLSYPAHTSGQYLT